MLLEWQKKQFKIWLGVELTVEAVNSEEAEQQAAAWVTATLAQGQPDSGVTMQGAPINLSEVAVKVLNQTAKERRLAQHNQASVPSDTE